jgi:hypothetical protein
MWCTEGEGCTALGWVPVLIVSDSSTSVVRPAKEGVFEDTVLVPYMYVGRAEG